MVITDFSHSISYEYNSWASVTMQIHLSVWRRVHGWYSGNVFSPLTVNHRVPWHVHGDVMPWKRFPHNWSFLYRTHRLPVESPYVQYLMQNFDVLSSLAWKRFWTSSPVPMIWDAFAFEWHHYFDFTMTSSNGNIFRVTGHLCGEFTGLRWIPRTKTSDAERWCFLWSLRE